MFHPPPHTLTLYAYGSFSIVNSCANAGVDQSLRSKQLHAKGINDSWWKKRPNVAGAPVRLEWTLPYILGYKPISRISRPWKNCRKWGILQKLAYKPVPEIPWCVVWANNKREGSLSKHLLFRKQYYRQVNYEMNLMSYKGNICTYRSKSLQKVALFSAVSIFMAVCMTDW